MKFNLWTNASLGLGITLITASSAFAVQMSDKNFGLDIKITAQSEDDRDLGRCEREPIGRRPAAKEIHAARDPADEYAREHREPRRYVVIEDLLHQAHRRFVRCIGDHHR